MMSSRLFFMGIIIAFLLFGSCVEKAENDEKILARINDYELTAREFQILLSEENEIEPDFKVTEAIKRAFLDEVIRKEVLIQEAKRLKLDQKEKFIRTIERYWEATLIRDLMALKGDDIHQTIVVTEEEIAQHYQQLNPDEKENHPLSALRNKIALELKEDKKTEALRRWIDALVKSADIKIDERLLMRQ